MGVRDGVETETKERNGKRLGELTLRGDIESFAILQKEKQRKELSGGEWMLFALVKRNESWCETAFQSGGHETGIRQRVDF